MKHHWMGEPIDEMPREKLLEIIDHLANDLARFQTPEMIHAMALGKSYQRIRGRSVSRRSGRGYHDCVECSDGKRECTCGSPSVSRPNGRTQ